MDIENKSNLPGSCALNAQQATVNLDTGLSDSALRERSIYVNAQLEADAMLELQSRTPIHKVKYILRDGELYTEDGHSLDEIINPKNTPHPLPKEVLAQFTAMREALLRGSGVKQVLIPSPASLYGSDYSGIGAFTLQGDDSVTFAFYEAPKDAHIFQQFYQRLIVDRAVTPQESRNLGITVIKEGQELSDDAFVSAAMQFADLKGHEHTEDIGNWRQRIALLASNPESD